VLAVCTSAQAGDGSSSISRRARKIQDRFEEFSKKGFRTLGIAHKEIGGGPPHQQRHESRYDVLRDSLFSLTRHSPGSWRPSPDSKPRRRAQDHYGRQPPRRRPASARSGIIERGIPHWPELYQLSDAALLNRVAEGGCLRRSRTQSKGAHHSRPQEGGKCRRVHGRCINDASALHAADVGISVDTAVDVAKDAADIVLLETWAFGGRCARSRATFANTLNMCHGNQRHFGNMFSMAGVSLILPFLPLLPSRCC